MISTMTILWKDNFDPYYEDQFKVTINYKGRNSLIPTTRDQSAM